MWAFSSPAGLCRCAAWRSTTSASRCFHAAASTKSWYGCGHQQSFDYNRSFPSLAPSPRSRSAVGHRVSGISLCRGYAQDIRSPEKHDDYYITASHMPASVSDEFSIFDMYLNQDGQFVIQRFLADLKAAGLFHSDPRLKDVMQYCRDAQEEQGGIVPFDDFKQHVQLNLAIIQKALLRKMVIPEWGEFATLVRSLYRDAQKNSFGEVANYIPQLAKMDPNLWAVSICTIDGQRLSLGDDRVPFCVQSSGKCMNYAFVLQDNGREEVHRYIGQEPSGLSFNELKLNSYGKPHNPMVNAGAILLTSLIKPGFSTAEKFSWLQDQYKRACPTDHIGFCNATFQSEKQTADRNFALGHLMREQGSFPQERPDLQQIMEFYFQTCSIEINARSGAVMAATLAAGGICPLTGEKVVSPDAVRNTLSLMLSCGMYDHSGQFAFEVGLPAKSGVSGCIYLVVPNVMGICLFSPPLDRIGNSVRGVHFARELVSTFNFHHYDSLLQNEGKWDPRRRRNSTKEHWVVSLLFSAGKGDVTALRRYVASGMDVSAVDYDGRSALHVAAAGGHVKCVEYLLSLPDINMNQLDRWQRTATDDAKYFGHDGIAALLEAGGGMEGMHVEAAETDSPPTNPPTHPT